MGCKVNSAAAAAEEDKLHHHRTTLHDLHQGSLRVNVLYSDWRPHCTCTDAMHSHVPQPRSSAGKYHQQSAEMETNSILSDCTLHTRARG